ncbi:hypothetical protein PVAND_009444 [Polypedilum vanderplanki]|uniref:Uncharacterized protein n=1 Tax=Polypedilum vanderplanki TaxID=319348 RepID=A0A9J6CCS3_POLVA|nr:hypothetical protein PVAND_009444 [Polypedilum vanderplanki]
MSFGELGCAYADNCSTAEEMILSAYSRGMASIETQKRSLDQWQLLDLFLFYNHSRTSSLPSYWLSLYLFGKQWHINIDSAFQDFAIEFEDVNSGRATTITKNQEVELIVVIQKGTGRFEILDGTNRVATGFVRKAIEPKIVALETPEDSNIPTLYSRDFYKELRLRWI